jgi:hypothetical protein
MASETVAAESPMEARIARLESDIGHLRSDVTEVKVDLRSLRDQLSSRIDRLAEQTNNRFDGVIAKVDDVGDSVTSTRVWTLTVLVTFAALVFGAMAHGFGWIWTAANGPKQKHEKTGPPPLLLTPDRNPCSPTDTR